MVPMQMQQMHMQAVSQQVPNQSQPPPQAQQQPPSQNQQTSQTPHLQQNQQFLSAHAQPDQNQRNGLKQRENSLFNSYVYDFLKRSGAHETARTYLREGENLIKLKNDGANPISGNSSSDNDVNGPLPEADVPVQAPEGFLYEWWSVFWDIYSVKLGRPGTMDAQRYVAERRGNRMISQIPTMSAYQQHPQVVAQAAAAQQHQQMRIMQQIPQHPPQQAQQASQQTVQQQQQQQAPPQQSQPPQQPQQTPQQPQPQPSPVNHQPQPFNNRQQMSNGVIDANNTNGDMLVTSPQRQNQLKTMTQRRPMTMQQLQQQQQQQVPTRQQMLLQHQQHPHLQNTAQVQAVQNQAQNSQPIQSQGQQQQNPVVNQGQVQQQTASQIHMTPNQAQAQLNPGTKRGVDVQTISQNMSMPESSSNKRQKIDYAMGQRQQQQTPNQQPGQMSISQNMMLTTPISGDIASPDMKNRQTHISNVKKNTPQMPQLTRGPQQQQMTPMNKPHVNQQMPIQNTIPHEADLVSKINSQINNANQSIQNIANFMPMSQMSHQSVMAASRLTAPQQYMMMLNNQRKNAIHPAAMLQLAEKQRNLHEMPMGVRPIQQQLYMVPGAHQMQNPIADIGPNNNSAQQRKNEVKGAKNGKTTPTQSQPQISNGSVSNVATPQQQQLVIGANEVQTQSQQPTQTSSTLQDGSLEMNLDEVYNFTSELGDLNFDTYLNFDFNDEQLGSNSNAGPSNGN